MPGAPGARAAWLLVDLRCSQGPGALETPGEDVGAARRLAPSAPERGFFEAMLDAAPPDLPAAARLFGKLKAAADAGDPAAPFELARLFAFWGEPGAVECPELAADASPAAIDAALARDSIDPFLPLPLAPRSRLAADLLSRARAAFDALSAAPTPLPDTLHEARVLVVAGLAEAPRDLDLLDLAGHARFHRVSRAVLVALGLRALRHSPYQLSDAFFGLARDLTASRDDMSYSPDFALPPAEFDAALHADLGADEALAAALEHGLPAAEVALAERGCHGLRKMEELDENGSLDPDERARLELGALLELESLRRLGGPIVLPLRAHLRRRALPAALGDGLAALDLERMLRVVGTIRVPLGGTPFFLLQGADVATEAKEGSQARRRWSKLYQVALDWVHALGVYEANTTTPDRETRRHMLASNLGAFFTLLMRPDHHALVFLRRGGSVQEDLSILPLDVHQLESDTLFTAPPPP